MFLATRQADSQTRRLLAIPPGTVSVFKAPAESGHHFRHAPENTL
jgi:hypothetical protein